MASAAPSGARAARRPGRRPVRRRHAAPRRGGRHDRRRGLAGLQRAGRPGRADGAADRRQHDAHRSGVAAGAVVPVPAAAAHPGRDPAVHPGRGDVRDERGHGSLRLDVARLPGAGSTAASCARTRSPPSRRPCRGLLPARRSRSTRSTRRTRTRRTRSATTGRRCPDCTARAGAGPWTTSTPRHADPAAHRHHGAPGRHRYRSRPVASGAGWYCRSAGRCMTDGVVEVEHATTRTRRGAGGGHSDRLPARDPSWRTETTWWRRPRWSPRRWTPRKRPRSAEGRPSV